jgi:signal recognition particle subunit SRP54
VFESLTDKLQHTFRRLSGKGKLGPRDIRDGLKEVRLALMEADVNYQVVKDFVNDIQQEALGEEILKGLNPTQQIVKIVHDHLVHLLGDAAVPIKWAQNKPTPIVLCGLQGSGKTTTAAKLALRFRKEGRKALLCATDVYRPAAIEQLQQVGAQAEVEVFTMGKADPVGIARAAYARAQEIGVSALIVDTAGRLHVDREMMDEIVQIEASLPEPETLLVVDAMTGQDAINVAREFGERLKLDGLILTKLDGDARGGAALSARAVTGVPIKFVGVGERLDGIEPFHPDRMAQRILNMGDVLTLVEKVQQALDTEEATKLQEKFLAADFDLEDFRQHLRNVRKMGPLDQILRMLPGAAQAAAMLPDDFDEHELDVVDAIICSMTLDERGNPDILNGSRKRRVARGSGTTVQDVNIVLKQYRELSKMMSAMSKGKGVQFGGMRFGRGR